MIYTIEEIQVAVGYVTADLEALHQITVPEVWESFERGLIAGRDSSEVPHPNEAYLGYATTADLIAELDARATVAAISREAWPYYRTVDAS